MITWMQKHKKWLVITIWISTIAFVGAGFVGWGSYNYNQSSSNVATVGSKVITIKELQSEYSNLYGQYQQMFGAQFNNEMAKQLNLEKVALNNLIQKSLLLNLAYEYGISATKEEIAKELVKIPAFIKDGKFDKATYIQVLKQNRTNPTEFEKEVKQNITLQKLLKVFRSKPNPKIVKTFNQILFSSDKVSVNILKLEDMKINFTDADIKNYWDANKDKYKSLTKYVISIEQLPLDDDPKKTKRAALKKYLAIKKGNAQFTQNLTIDQNTAFIGKENLQKIFSSKVGTLLKPLKTSDQYIIVKVNEVIEPKVLDFSEVKDIVKQDYIRVTKREKLIKARNDVLSNFKGKDLGYISKNQKLTIDGLEKEEVEQLVQNVFNSTTTVDFVELANKTVVYKIYDTKLGKYDPSQDYALSENISKIADQVLLTNLLEKLKAKYPITTNVKVD